MDLTSTMDMSSEADRPVRVGALASPSMLPDACLGHHMVGVVGLVVSGVEGWFWP